MERQCKWAEMGSEGGTINAGTEVLRGEGERGGGVESGVQHVLTCGVDGGKNQCVVRREDAGEEHY